jgi:hypothetical protein
VHAALAQAWGVQSLVDPGTQFPLPSHFDAPTRMALPPMQAAAAQVVPAV